jgi:uncharacterized protein
VDYRRQFLISFGGLKPGNHSFDFEIDDRFFEEFDYAEYKSGKLKVNIEMERQQRMLILQFIIKGELLVDCNRCLEIFPLAIDGYYQLFVKFGPENAEESDDVVVLAESETRIDVGHYIYEYIMLSVPFRHVHPYDGCDTEILKKLEQMKPVAESDPRWDALKNIKNQFK